MKRFLVFFAAVLGLALLLAIGIAAEEQTATLATASDELDARLDMVRERAVTLIVRSREEATADIEAMQTAAAEKMREAVKHIEWELTDI